LIQPMIKSLGTARVLLRFQSDARTAVGRRKCGWRGEIQQRRARASERRVKMEAAMKILCSSGACPLPPLKKL